MAATKVPNLGLPSSAQTVRTTFNPGVGTTSEYEYTGTAAECLGKYNVWMQQAQIGGIPGNNIREVQLERSEGRGRVIARFSRDRTESIAGEPNDVAVVEELMAVDVVRDCRAAAYFLSGGTAAVTDDGAAVVKKAVDFGFTEAEITEEKCGIAWASWTAGMKELRYHMLHGQESYYETAFILRRSKTGILTSKIKEAFTNINIVVPAPEFATEMDKLILALPAGEWLYKPPQAEYLGEGKWRITQEWHWAVAWSKMYGGTWGI